MHEGLPDARSHGERHFRLLLPSLQGLLGFRVALGQEDVGTIDDLLRRWLPAVQRALLAIVARRLADHLCAEPLATHP